MTETANRAKSDITASTTTTQRACNVCSTKALLELQTSLLLPEQSTNDLEMGRNKETNGSVKETLSQPDSWLETTRIAGTTVADQVKNILRLDENQPEKDLNPAIVCEEVPPTLSIIFPRQQRYVHGDQEGQERAVHRINLSSLEHNYRHVESVANRQKCSVITVVKADGYGHGAIPTALHLSDSCGCDSFAVATLEEGIALRKAFQENPPGRWKKQIATLVEPPSTTSTIYQKTTTLLSSEDSLSSTQTTIATSALSTQQHVTVACCRRPTRIRILVLGPPIGFPKCFNEYYHYNIEVMISGPEVAASLLAWVANEKERKQHAVERAATDSKEAALHGNHRPVRPIIEADSKKEQKLDDPCNNSQVLQSTESCTIDTTTIRKMLPHPSNTLSNVQGQDLAREVRLLLINQKAATNAAEQQQSYPSVKPSATPSSVYSDTDSEVNSNSAASSKPLSVAVGGAVVVPQTEQHVFEGIEAIAKHSRVREMATTASGAVTTETPLVPVPVNRNTQRRLRWHALVDSGMGRLGFRTDSPAQMDKLGRRDTVSILHELVNAEIFGNAPIEFYGMCTHMADANADSTYTNDQIGKFKSLLKSVRDSGIVVPTISTDNSAALLTPTLTHFDPSELLSQHLSPTRGYVRCGGAIYGQRPAFRELRAVSTLTASVRHVAVLQKGESVGYDRAYVAPYDVRIATLTIGFADGYPRELGNGVGKVWIRGCGFGVAGNVCMDMLMVELCPAEEMDGVGSTVVVGDTAILWGMLDNDDYNEDCPMQLADIAATLNTTQSALTCGLNKTRVARLYTKALPI